MYRCERCGGTFASFETPGQCPLCGTWASVRCTNCGHTDVATAFTSNGNRCPSCNAAVSLPGAAGAPRVNGRDFVTGAGCLLLLTACWLPFTLSKEIQNGRWWVVIVAVVAAVAAIAALRWGLKGRTKQ